jgi:hypothetical protein
MTRRFLISVFLLQFFIVSLSGRDIRLALGNAEFTSYTRIGFLPNATAGFDKLLDKEIRTAPQNRINYIFTSDNTNRLIYENYYPSDASYLAILVHVQVADTGFFELTLEDLDGDLGTTRVSLTDASGKLYVMSPGSVTVIHFEEPNLKKGKIFTLHIFKSPVISSTPVSCAYSKNGTIHVSLPDEGEWSASLRTVNALISYAPVATREVLFEHLSPNVYLVQLKKNNVVVHEEYTAVSYPAQVKPQFTVTSDTIAAGEKVYLSNNSTGGTSWYWQFGDNATSPGFSPSHAYPTPGEYKITLTVSNLSGCAYSAQKTLTVMPSPNPVSLSAPAQ